MLKTQYVKFIREFESLGHMAQADNVREDKKYFLSHHGVGDNFSTATRLRVVCDSSFTSKSGHSGVCETCNAKRFVYYHFVSI